MSASKEQLQRAKKYVSDQIGDAPWMRGIGIGLVEDEAGVVVSVAADGAKAARMAIDKLRLPFPVRIRVLGPIRKQDS